MTNGTLVWIDDLDHASIGEKRLVGQRFAWRSDGRDTQTRGLGGTDPFIRRKLPERLCQLLVHENPGQHPIWLHRDPIGIISVRCFRLLWSERVTRRRREDPSRTKGPMMDPLPISTLVDAFDGPRIDGPHPIERRIGILHALPIETHRSKCSLEEGSGYMLTLTTHLSGT